MACCPAPLGPSSAARSVTAAVDRADRAYAVSHEATSPRGEVVLARSASGCTASMEGRAALAGGVRTAHGVLPSAIGSEQRSSVGHSRGGSSEHRLAIGGHRSRRGCGCDCLATSEKLCREHRRSCCVGRRCQDGPWRAAQRHGVRSAQLGRAQPRWIERSTRRWWSPWSARLCGCDSRRRAPRSSERVLSAHELRSGPPTAPPVPTDGTGRQPLSFIAVSNASTEHAAHCGAWLRLTVLLVATSAALLRASSECS